MDRASEQAVRLLEALARAYFRLREFGYEMFVRGRLTQWTENVHFSLSPFTVDRDGGPDERFTRNLPIGIGGTLPDGRAISWDLNVQWDADRWTIDAEVWLEQDGDCVMAGEFPRRTAETIDECIAQIDLATTDLLSADPT